MNVFVSTQVSPWVHGELSVGFDGVGAIVGFDVNDMSYDFEINVGLGAFVFIFFPQIFSAGNQVVGANY